MTIIISAIIIIIIEFNLKIARKYVIIASVLFLVKSKPTPEP